jgi:hypothetical protein
MPSAAEGCGKKPAFTGPPLSTQSITVADEQVHELDPTRAPSIKRNKLRAVYARILAAGNSKDELTDLVLQLQRPERVNDNETAGV